MAVVKSFSQITTWGADLALSLMKIVLTFSVKIRQLPVYMDINAKLFNINNVGTDRLFLPS